MNNRNTQDFICNAWHGKIALWQSIFCSIVGLVFSVIIASIIGIAMLFLKTNGYVQFDITLLNKLVAVISLLVLNGFSIHSVWACASLPKDKLSHAIARLWACLLGTYVLVVSFTMIASF